MQPSDYIRAVQSTSAFEDEPHLAGAQDDPIFKLVPRVRRKFNDPHAQKVSDFLNFDIETHLRSQKSVPKTYIDANFFWCPFDDVAE